MYNAIAAIAVLLVLPLAPFSPKLHRGLVVLAVVTFTIITGYLWLVFPFTYADPLKLFFQQRVQLNPSDVFFTSPPLAPSLPKVTTLLTGPPSYVESVLERLPSTRGKDLNCTADVIRPGLTTCEWESGSALEPQPGGKDPWSWWPGADTEKVNSTSIPLTTSWFKADVSRTSWDSAKITIQGRNTKNCRLYFDAPSDNGVRVVRYTVEGASKGMQPGYPVDPKDGLKELRLWSRTWGKTWVVNIDWEPTKIEEPREEDGKLTGRIACEWVEYESGMVDNGQFVKDEERAKIPALEEALSFLPDWATVTKVADGLVEAWVPFTV